MKNTTTPRTLDDCTFAIGYQRAVISRRDRWAGVALAVFLGVVMGAMLVEAMQ